MNLVIVEDDDFKLARLQSYMSLAMPGSTIETARSYKSGLRALVARSRDLVLMDMTMPTFDITPGAEGGRPLILGGRDLLRQMKRRGLRYPTVVVTGFESFGFGTEMLTLAQLDGELRQEFGEFYKGSVYFNATSDEWKDSLAGIVLMMGYRS